MLSATNYTADHSKFQDKVQSLVFDSGSKFITGNKDTSVNLSAMLFTLENILLPVSLTPVINNKQKIENISVNKKKITPVGYSEARGN
jgi:hypothetical protein